jgi:hypothetical protein
MGDNPTYKEILDQPGERRSLNQIIADEKKRGQSAKGNKSRVVVQPEPALLSEVNSILSQAGKNKLGHYVGLGMLFIFGCLTVPSLLGFLSFILAIGYFAKIVGINVTKQLSRYGDARKIIREIDADLLSNENHIWYSDDLVKTQNYIIKMRQVGLEKNSIMRIDSIRKILRDKSDSKPAYNKTYKDSIILRDEFGAEMELECKVKREETSILDEIVKDLMKHNPKISEGKYQRQIITE